MGAGGACMRSPICSRSCWPSSVTAIIFTRRSSVEAAALDQAARLEAVDDAGHVRGVAVQRLGQRAHRQLLPGLEVLEREHLHRRQVELRRRWPTRAALVAEERARAAGSQASRSGFGRSSSQKIFVNLDSCKPQALCYGAESCRQHRGQRPGQGVQEGPARGRRDRPARRGGRDLRLPRPQRRRASRPRCTCSPRCCRPRTGTGARGGLRRARSRARRCASRSARRCRRRRSTRS